MVLVRKPVTTRRQFYFHCENNICIIGARLYTTVATVFLSPSPDTVPSVIWYSAPPCLAWAFDHPASSKKLSLRLQLPTAAAAVTLQYLSYVCFNI